MSVIGVCITWKILVKLRKELNLLHRYEWWGHITVHPIKLMDFSSFHLAFRIMVRVNNISMIFKTILNIWLKIHHLWFNSTFGEMWYQSCFRLGFPRTGMFSEVSYQGVYTLIIPPFKVAVLNKIQWANEFLVFQLRKYDLVKPHTRELNPWKAGRNH